MSRLTKEQRGIAVWLTNAGIRQAELSENFILFVYTPFLYSFNRTYPKPMHNTIPFLSIAGCVAIFLFGLGVLIICFSLN